MKKKVALASVAIIFIFAAGLHAEELEMINRPVNLSGLTGLFYTTAPFSIPAKSVEISLAATTEKSSVPSYSLSELPAVAVTLGFKETMELALKSSYFHKTVQEGGKGRGFGDTSLSYKWNFLPQQADRVMPAVAFLFTAIAPHPRYEEVDMAGVAHWGAQFGLCLGKEVTWGDHIVAVYADGKLAMRDLNVSDQRDRYGIANSGILFPVSKYRNLQMLIEYSVINGIDTISSEGGDYSAITYGLRLVTERFNLSIGTQFVHKQERSFENSSRVVGMMSMKL